MTATGTKKVQGHYYYYLKHFYRDGRIPRVIELYIGPTIPGREDLDRLKADLVSKVFRKRWSQAIEAVRTRYRESQARMSPAAQRKALDEFIVRFTRDSLKLEGSSLDLAHVRDIALKNVVPSARPLDEVLDAKAHVDTCHIAFQGTIPLSVGMIAEWERQLAMYGRAPVPSQPGSADPFIKKTIEGYLGAKDSTNPALLAAIVLFRLARNAVPGENLGRIARICVNYVLLAAAYPPVTIGLPERQGYTGAIKRAKARDDELLFVAWFFRVYLKQQAIK
jgi:hypothetical protein